MSLHDGLLEMAESALHLVFKLEIGGLPVIFYEGTSAPTLPTATDAEGTTVAGLSYRAHPGLIPPREHIQETDYTSGLPEAGSGMTVTLRSAGDREDLYADDPVRLMGRLGLYGADWSADLLETVAHQADGPTTWKVSNDPSTLTFPRLFYIGQEAIWATGSGGTGTALDPYTLTGVMRGVLGSPVQRHVANPARGLLPRVTSDKIHWASARATISCANVGTSTGFTGEWVEVVHGTLAGAPRIIQNGAAMAVTVVPLVNKLSSKLGADAEPNYLLDGKHHFSYPEACNLWASVRLRPRMLFGETDGNSPQGGGYLRSEINTLEAHEDIFDPTVAGRALDDPRRGPIATVNNPEPNEVLWPDGYVTNGGGPGNRFLLLTPDSEGQATPDFNVSTNSSWATVEINHTYTVAICTEGEGTKTVNWPGDVLAIWNGDEGLNPGTTQGEHGQFLSIRLDPNVPEYVVRANSSQISGARVYLSALERFLLPRDVMWFPIQPAEFEAQPQRRPNVVGSRFAGDARARAAGAIRDSDYADPLRFPAGEIPTAWYQLGERVMLVRDDAPVDPPFDIKVDLELDGVESDDFATARVSASVFSADAGGYIWTLSDTVNMPSFGNFSDRKPRIRPVIRLRGEDIIDVLLKVLMSGAGNGVNSATYDVFPYGLNIPESRVDVASFTSFPRGLARWERLLEDGVDVRELFEGILDLLGAVIVSRLDRTTATFKVALAPAAIASPAESVLDLLQARMSNPQSSNYEEKFNRVVYTLSPPQGDSFEAVLDDTAAQAASETGVQAREIDLSGLMIGAVDPGELDGYLRLAYSRKRALLAFSRRRFRVRIPLGLSMQLSVGSVVSVTHNLLVPANPGAGRGVSGAPCRITKLIRKFGGSNGAHAELVLEYSGANTAGYAPALTVASVVNATTVTVELNAHTVTPHPYTQETVTDLRVGDSGNFFEAGDEVIRFTEGDFDGATTINISTINYTTREIVFEENHDAAVGDIIEPSGWANASARMRGWAFLGSRAFSGAPHYHYS